ncbi:MAG: hypothetical protein AAGH87_08955 [Pseudomonadota bacterium]
MLHGVPGMYFDDRFKQAAILAMVPLIGLIGLLTIEAFSVMAEAGRLSAGGGNGLDAFSAEFANFIPIIGGMMILSALPIILLALGPNPITKWTTFGLVLLLFLANAAHIAEHVVYGDFLGAGVILATGVLPYGLVLYLVFRAKLGETAGNPA